MASAGEETPATDPNSLEIMRQAVDSVARNSRGRSGTALIIGAQIEPTHRYVCFHPATDTQWDALLGQQDFISSGIFPLDQVSPVSEEENYYTPSEGGTFDCFYAVMPVTVVLPDTITHEVLKELYDPASTEDGQADPAWAQRVTAQARALSDGDRHPGDIPWKPSGQLRVWDDLFGRYVPLEGVDVTLTDPTNLLSPIKLKTDANGRYSYSQSISGSRNHSYSLSNTYWRISHDSYRHTGSNGPALSGAWNVNISQSSTVSWQMAMVYRGVYRYWYKSGLSKPDFRGVTKPGVTEQILKVRCSDSTTVWSSNTTQNNGFLSNKDRSVKIACKAAYPGKLFEIVVHELGHAAHFVHATGDWNACSTFIKESWATFTEWLLTEQEYGVFVHTTYTVPGTTQTYIEPDNLNMQSWIPLLNAYKSLIYTPIFIDLYDNFDQYYWYSVIEPGYYHASDLLKIPKDKISLGSNLVEQIVFKSSKKADLFTNIRSVAVNNGMQPRTIEDFLDVYQRFLSDHVEIDEMDPERH